MEAACGSDVNTEMGKTKMAPTPTAPCCAAAERRQGGQKHGGWQRQRQQRQRSSSSGDNIRHSGGGNTTYMPSTLLHPLLTWRGVLVLLSVVQLAPYNKV